MTTDTLSTDSEHKKASKAEVFTAIVSLCGILSVIAFVYAWVFSVPLWQAGRNTILFTVGAYALCVLYLSRAPVVRKAAHLLTRRPISKENAFARRLQDPILEALGRPAISLGRPAISPGQSISGYIILHLVNPATNATFVTLPPENGLSRHTERAAKSRAHHSHLDRHEFPHQ